MSVSLTKEIAGICHVTIARTHTNPTRAARDLARASFWHCPGTLQSITAVAPELPSAGYSFAPSVTYTVTAFRPAQGI